jgi:hypothetical protein
MANTLSSHRYSNTRNERDLGVTKSEVKDTERIQCWMTTGKEELCNYHRQEGSFPWGWCSQFIGQGLHYPGYSQAGPSIFPSLCIKRLISSFLCSLPWSSQVWQNWELFYLPKVTLEINQLSQNNLSLNHKFWGKPLSCEIYLETAECPKELLLFRATMDDKSRKIL